MTVTETKPYGQDLVIRTKLMLPRPRRYLLPRPALSAQLQAAQRYRITVVQASTGYGKSTALVSAFQSAPVDFLWYGISETDRDPLLFLLHLIYAFRLHWPDCGTAPLAQIQEGSSSPLRGRSVVASLVNDLALHQTTPTILVLDDYHLVNQSAEINALVDYFLEVLPPRLHLVISTRQRPALQTLTRWRVKGELLEITQRELAFSPQETEALFRTQYGLDLQPEQVQRLAHETEGWVIALQMIWQSLQSGAAASLDDILAELPRSLEDLFSYLAQDVLARRPAHLQDFLLNTAILRQLEAPICDHLLDWSGSGSLLNELYEEGFFLVRLGEAYRYQHLFHDFLRQQAQIDQARVQALHRRAAAFFQAEGDTEEAIYHWLAASENQAAAELMVQASRSLLREGRFDTLSQWVDALPADVLAGYPVLLFQMGELCRFTSRFDEALAWYEHAQQRFLSQRDVAGSSRALRGQAAIYLDTVRPIRAESLLQEALWMVDGQQDRTERANLLELMAENRTNRGQWEEASLLRQQARELREEGPAAADLDVRVLLRTGRLDEARAVLETRAAEERRSPACFREPRSHRETLLLLSLVCSWQGQSEEAFACAREGIDVGRRLGSPFVEVVGYMRLGHAWQILDHPESAGQAFECYQKAIEQGEHLAVPRLKAEALLGLTRLYGFRAELTKAEQSAGEGIEVSSEAGDEWMAALIGVTLGAAYVVGERYEDAEHWLNQSAIGFRELGDPFGQTIACLWFSLVCLRRHGLGPQLRTALGRLLGLVGKNGYGFLFGRTTFLAPPDPPQVVPLLVAAAHLGVNQALVGQLVQAMDLAADLPFHPGYTLRVHALGQFAVHRGGDPVREGEWRREKARQLLCLFLTQRDRFMLREEIEALLWPDSPAAAAERQFKVTLNALNYALEPERPPRAPTLFVQRQGSTYGLNPSAPLWLDSAVFESLILQAERQPDPEAAMGYYQRALTLYRGPFLPDCVYDDWCRDEQERLRRLYLNAATKTAEILLQRDELDSVIATCQAILTADNCWETAYQYLIQVYLRQGDRVQALRTYERCVATLRNELDVGPSPETIALSQRIK